MSRVAGIMYSDTPHVGGFAFINAMDLKADSANLAFTRNAASDYSLNRIAAGAETFNILASPRVGSRILEVYNFQEQFGGTNGPIPLAGTPPYAGYGPLTVPTTAPKKGIKIVDVMLVYQVGVVDLTSAALVLNKVVYANNVALAKTNIPISATALSLTAAGSATGPYALTRTVTTPDFIVDDLSDVMAEFQVVMANTGTIKVYGIGFHYSFNWL